MKIYYFHHDTRTFIGEGSADPSPVKKGEWLIPGNATEIEPPLSSAGKVAVFDGAKWGIVADNRGKWYDVAGNEIEVSNPGEPAPEGASRDPRPSHKHKLVAGEWVLDITLAKAAKLAEINRAFEAAAAPLTAGYPPSEKVTWPIQETEVLAWQKSSLALTPYINALAVARGIARADFLERTLAKVQALRAASAVLVGTRQKYEDRVHAAEQLGDVAAIDAVEPVF